MIKAKTTVIVGNKIFRPGQTVTGLSKTDKEWMKKAGYITETTGKKEMQDKETSAAAERAEEKEDEFY